MPGVYAPRSNNLLAIDTALQRKAPLTWPCIVLGAALRRHLLR